MSNVKSRPSSPYWMRSVSFAGLHRILHAIGDTPCGLRAKEINDLVLSQKLTLTPRSSPPKPTTLYHYRNALLHLRALERDGKRLRVNVDNSDVCDLLRQPAPADGDQSLNASAREHFAALVVNNTQCRTLFFDLFMPSDRICASVSDFRSNGAPVTWMRKRLSSTTKVVFENKIAERTVWHTSPESVPALLYGLRYWARDELKLIDECSQRTDGRVLMFPVYGRTSSTHQDERSVRKAVRFLLDHRTADEWTLFSISDLIVDYCQTHRQPRAVLFAAIAWLRREWPHHTVLIPTSHGLATLTAMSPQQEALELRRYYKTTNGPYISHFRIHETVTTEPTATARRHVQHASEARA